VPRPCSASLTANPMCIRTSCNGAASGSSKTATTGSYARRSPAHHVTTDAGLHRPLDRRAGDHVCPRHRAHRSPLSPGSTASNSCPRRHLEHRPRRQPDVHRDDFAAAIAALDCPAIRRPVVKLGHFGHPRPGGGPPRRRQPRRRTRARVGRQHGLADSRRTLVGDLVGMPGWLGQIAASAYPDRSIEGCRNYVCQIGHRHPFVISAVALLGVTPPGVGTLGSLTGPRARPVRRRRLTPTQSPTGSRSPSPSTPATPARRAL
jgi:hypothetical protein